MALKVGKEVGEKHGKQNGSHVKKSWLVASAVQEKVEARKRAGKQPLQNDRKGF